MLNTESVVHGSAMRANLLPAIGTVLDQPACKMLVQKHGHTIVVNAARVVLQGLRNQLKAPLHTQSDTATQTQQQAMAGIIAAIESNLKQKLAGNLQSVFNLTGTVLHTNLGRATLARPVLDHLVQVAAGPNTLEYDLHKGQRGDRDNCIEQLLCELTGAEAATVVNNNAAAVLLTIAALAQNRQVIVSRGELVEIGGSFRMPDVMAAAGAHMVEVGTTNRTHLHDYENAISPDTALLMKVHTSNYEVQGFTTSVDEQHLAQIARKHGLPLASDLGSGSLIDFAQYGLPKEPLVQEKLRAGCDVVTFSGDKLLGGPQAGILVGCKQLIEKIKRHPLKRALRMGQLPMAALEGTLRMYLRPELLPEELPVLRMLTRPAEQIQTLATTLMPVVQQHCGTNLQVQVQELQSQIGSGSLPGRTIPSYGLQITVNGSKKSGKPLEKLAHAWRSLPKPVIGRIANNSFVLDLRCLEDPDGFKAQLGLLNKHLVLKGLA